MLKFHAHIASLNSLQCTTWWKGSLASGFAQYLLSVYTTATTSTVQRCTLQPTAWPRPHTTSTTSWFMYTYILHVLDYHLSMKCWLLLCSWYNLDLVGINSGWWDANFWYAIYPSCRCVDYWQYAYSGHVINLPQNVTSFTNLLPQLPSELDIIVVRKEGATNTHRDFRVRRGVVLHALQWFLLITGTTTMFTSTLMPSLCFPEDGNLTGLHRAAICTEWGPLRCPSFRLFRPQHHSAENWAGDYQAVCARATASSASTQARPNDALSISLVRKLFALKVVKCNICPAVRHYFLIF